MLLGWAIFCVSTGVLGYEILLMRLLTITQWHHFAYMIISVALLGFGVSGAVVCLAQDFLLRHFLRVFVVNAICFSLAVVLCFVAAQHVPLNPLEILWNRGQWLYLFETYLLLAFPFFLAANCISITYARRKNQIHRIYLFDLIGAGTGALGIVLLLSSVRPVTCLKLLSMPGLLAAGLANLRTASVLARRLSVVLLVAGLLLPLAWPDSWLHLRISEYKGLSMALRVPGAQIVSEASSPLGWLAVVESPTIPFRYAPGLSLKCTAEPPLQLGVFIDGDALSPIIRYDGKIESVRYLDCMTSALPYHLVIRPRVLVLGAGGGADVLTALYHQSRWIDAVELDVNMVRLVREEFSDFAGNLYNRKDVRVHVSEARGFVARTSGLYDVIQVSMLDSFNASAAGGHALNETYLYTVEALQEYYRHLHAGGILSVTRWLKVPPRDGLKLFATAVAALEESGVVEPGKHLALIRGWNTSTLLMKKGDFTKEDLGSLRTFCKERSFDVSYYPGIEAAEVNRYNELDRPYFYEGALSLLSAKRKSYIARYKFDISPATDDRPYFFHFFKWKSLPEFISLRGQGGLPLVEWTYPILILTFVQSVAVSAVLILLPLAFGPHLKESRRGYGRSIVYFLCLGFAFLFVEIAFIQKFILFLSHPIYAVSVVLAGFLIFAGLGSGFSGRRHRIPGDPDANKRRSAHIAVAVTAIIAISIAYMLFLPPLFQRLMAMPDLIKAAISILFIAPLAFCMGMPFPLGLSIVAEVMPTFIPWVWGINGCASVMSAVLATILAVHFGFNAVIGAAAMLYALAAGAYWRSPGSRRLR